MDAHQSGLDNAYVFMSLASIKKYNICELDRKIFMKEWNKKSHSFREQTETLMAGINSFSKNICAVPMLDAQHGTNPDDKCILGVVTQPDSEGTFKKAPYNAANPTNKWTIEQAISAIAALNTTKSRAA